MKEYRDIISGTSLLLIGLMFLYFSYDDSYASMGRGVQYGTMFFPRLLLVVWLVLSAVLAIKGVVGLRRGTAGTGIDESGSPHLRITVMAISFVIVAVGAWLIPTIGFVPAMVGTMLATAALLGWRRHLILIAVSVFWPIAIWYIFTTWLRFPLPETSWLPVF